MANAFESECAVSAKALGLHYQKVAVPTVVRRGRAIPVKDNNYDSFIIKPGGIHVALELKSQAVHGSFPLKNIQDHQLTGLQDAVNLGCPAYLLINMRRAELNGKLRPKNEAWALEFQSWMDLLNALPYWRGKPRHSIPVDLFQDPKLFRPIPRVHMTVPQKPKPQLCWDLRVLL
jgi:penicillin-binding protein-related factor A (putative recombinase)